MDSLVQLRTVLDSVLGEHPISFGEQDLVDQLLSHTTALVALLDVGPRSAAEQEEIQKGNINIDGKSIVVDAYFAQLVNFLAQQLQCSERYLASLLLKIPPSLSVEQKLEGVIYQLHSHRTAILDCVDALLSITLAVEATSASFVPPLLARVASFVRTHLFGSPPQSSWASRIFQQMSTLSATIASATTAAQNASSATVAPNTPGSPGFGAEVLADRVSSLVNERQRLGEFLVKLSKLGALHAQDVKTLVNYLVVQPPQPMTYAVLASFMWSLDIADPDTPVGQARLSLSSDTDLVAFFSQKLNSSSPEWSAPGLKAVALLRWTLFQIHAREIDPTLETKEAFNPDNLESQVSSGIQGDSFLYIARTILQLKKQTPSSLYPLLLLPPLPDQPAYMEAPGPQLAEALLSSFEVLIRSLLFFASPEIRKVKQRQEDLVLASARSAANHSRFGARNARLQPSDKQPPRNDIDLLFSLIGLIYSSVEPELALPFWGSGPPEAVAAYLENLEAGLGRLPAFLQWAVWSTQPHHVSQITALYNMIGGLANGRHCSEFAYNFMAQGGGEVITGSSMPSGATSSSPASWQYLFDTLATFVPPPHPSTGPSLGLGPTHFAPQQTSTTLSAEHVLLGRSFLVLLSTVVSNSIDARRALFSNSHFRPVVSLANLISLSIPLELKGAIFDTMAAFCLPGAGFDGVEICRSVWFMLEKLEVVNVRPLSAGFSALSSLKGVEMELDQVESANKTYPASLPFLRLLCTLLHTPKRVPLRDRDDIILITFPESLGQPYRLPGIGPYTNFVLDNVLANIGNREFNDPSDQWEMMGLCLCYTEHALASYRLEDLYLIPSVQSRRDALLPFLVHPGYDIMLRLLQESPFLQTVLSSLVEGVARFDQARAQWQPAFVSAIVRLLRIVHRTLEIQDYFLDILIPLLSEIDCSSIIGATHTRSSFTRIDQALSYNTPVIPSLAVYSSIEEYRHSELGLLSVKILTYLSKSKVSSAVTTLVERSEHAFRILEGFCNILSLDTLEDPDHAIIIAEESTGAGAPDFKIGQTHPQAVRLAVLDLLTQNTVLNARSPNLAHFFFFGHKDQWAPRSCGRVILRLISQGVPTLSNRQPSTIQPLFVRLPSLAERCYRVVYQLCVHPKSPSYLMRDLRTEDFFARQLLAVPIIAPEADNDTCIEVVYSDGTRITTTSSAFSSFLKLRSWILELCAVDLHFLTTGRFGTKVSDILNILFATVSSLQQASGFMEIGHSRMRIIEYIQSLTFDWTDSLSVGPGRLEFFGDLNLSNCTTRDESGVDVIDRVALLTLLSTSKRQLQLDGRITTEGHLVQVDQEKAYILQSCAVENNRRCIVNATALSYQSWRRLLDVTLTKCFSRLPPQSRESVLFDLLYTLPPIISSQDADPSTTVLLSETVLSCMNKLREERHQPSSSVSAPPAERLEVILRSLLHSILDAHHQEQVRGNLYAALINFLHLLHGPGSRSELAGTGGSSILSVVAKTPSPALSAYFSQIHSVSEKLVLTVARDAMDGTEIWRTVAFMLLDGLLQLPYGDRKNPVILTLVRHGILDNLVRGLKETDERLQSVLLPDPEDLNPLYIFEAKMSFFIAAAQTRNGAERLLESRLIPALASCDFLDARPEAENIDHDSFLPSSIQRYHQLFLPSLQVINAVVMTLPTHHKTAATQVLEFLQHHASTIIILLKDTTEVLSLSMLQEIHLLVTLCTASIPLVPKSELLSATSGFGAIHAAIMAVSTKLLSGSRWMKDVKPESGVELANSAVVGPGRQAMSRFELDVKNAHQLLLNSLAQYISSVCDLSYTDGNVVFSPIVSIGPYGERGTGFLASVPSLSDAIDTLDNLCSELAENLTLIRVLGAEIAAKEHINVDTLHQMELVAFSQLDTAQRREIAADMFSELQLEVIRSLKRNLSSLEMLLLLTWQHVLYYVQSGHKESKPKASLAHTMRLLANVDSDTFKDDVTKRMSPVLGRLHSIQTDETLPSWRTSITYVDIMVRRIREAIGMPSEEAELTLE